MALSVSQKCVIGKENTYGTAPSSSTDGITNAAFPIETANINLMIEPFNDQTKRGATGLDSNVYPTVRRVEGNVEGPFFTDECAYFLLALLGTDSVATGASNQNTHTFSGKTSFSAPNANSLTIDVRDDVSNAQAILRSFRGLYVQAFTLRFSAAEGIMTYTSSVIGQDAYTAFALNDATFAEPVPIFGWTGQVWQGTASRTSDDESTIAGGTAKLGLIDAELTINRPVQLTYVFRNQQICKRADPGPIECTARFTYDWDTSSTPDPLQWFTDYTHATDHQKGYVFELTNAQTGSSARKVRIYLPAASILDAPLEIDRSDIAMRFNVGVRAVNNTNAAISSPVRIKLTSRKDTVYGS